MKNFYLLFEKQVQHYLYLAALLLGIVVITRTVEFFAGHLWGTSSGTWFFLAIAVAVFHHIYVWFCWRVQLHMNLITRLFGTRGFIYYSIGFAILFSFRFILVILLAVSNRGSLDADPFLLNGLALVIALPAIYLFYSMYRYFGPIRALGIDHFDESYRYRPLVKEGIFKFVKNPLYVFGMALIWIPGLVYSSRAALLAALFNHIYIWAHYYFTEKPDMKRIYGTSRIAEN